MYSAHKEKIVPMSPRYKFRRILPRYTKAYVWLCFLISVFGYMLLLDNGISLYSYRPQFRHGFAMVNNSNSNTTETEKPSTKISYTASTQYHITPTHVPFLKSEPDSDSRNLVYGSGSTAFTPDDVVILFKTGATSLWSRVPIHLSTTLANSTLTPNIVFYSDQEGQIAGHPIIDVLANVSTKLKESRDFDLYHKLKTLPSQNRYLEHATIDGDHWLPGGWRLDKYKFLPLMSHAALNYPDKKWYIYMEDDNYFFWHSLYHWLSTLDPSTPLFLGGPAARLGEDFAHGGSGFIVSGAAMSQTFGANPDLALEWESYTAERCCGDQVLSHLLAVNGVPRDRRHDHTGWAGLQALQHWRMAFGHWNWCSPLFNVHKVHQSDISTLHVLEQQFQSHSSQSRIMTWGALYELTIAPTQITTRRKLEWDNDAHEKWFSSKESDQELSDADRARRPWFSANACEAACDEWALCLSWKYADDNCGLSSTVVAGRPVDEGVALTSGFHLDRIDTLRGKRCPSLWFGS